MKTLYTLNRPLTARFVAAVTVVSLLLSAFPAAFFVAEATTQTPQDLISEGGPFSGPLLGDLKIRICHATGNGYQGIEVSVNSIVTGSGHGGDDEDIIPPFLYFIGFYPGQNWWNLSDPLNFENIQIWQNDCSEEEEPTPEKIYETIVVTPSNLQGFVIQETGGGDTEFVIEATAPLGDGVLKLISDAQNSARAGASKSVDVALADLEGLSYKTRQNDAIPEGNAAYRISFDADGDTSTTNDVATLIHEPYWQNAESPDPAPVVPDVWQTWNVDNGHFWVSVPGGSSAFFALNGITNGAGGPPFFTLAQMKGFYPSAKVTSFGVHIGSYNPLYNIDVDQVVFGTNAKESTYDFEPDEFVPCQYNPEIDAESENCVEPKVTLSLTKIVCEDESMLPNDGFASIDGNTATNFLIGKEGCAVEPGFEFQWAFGGQPVNPANDNAGALENPWTTTTVTNGSGVATVAIPATQLANNNIISVREVWSDDYIPFTGQNGGPVSAEIYCASDAANYDNLEWIQGVTVNNTYHCVAWNVEVPEVPECQNLLANGSFETPVVTHESLWDKFLGAATSWLTERVSDNTTTTLELHRDWSSNEAADGAQYAELDGDHSTKISQTVTLEEGATYELRWAYAPRHDAAAAENQLSVLIDGTPVGANGPASGIANMTTANWTQGLYEFVANDNSATITFADAGATSDSYGTFLDDAHLCKTADPEPVATVVAEKIVCEDEADLPNWNDEGNAPNITANTAADFVAQSEGACWLEPNWQFEWGTQAAADPGDTLVGPAGTAAWTTFGPTNGLGKATAFLTEEDLDDDSYIWMREVLKTGYIPFTHEATPDNSNNETAEMYCHVDGLNYDNIDRIDGIEVGETYHCVAFNAEIPEPAPVCELDIVSSTQTVLDTYGLAIETYDGHESWTDNVEGATWIWASEYVPEPEESESHTFTETFTVDTPTSALLDIAGDNTYKVYVNDILVLDRSLIDNNFMDHTMKTDVDILSALNPTGENTIRFEVTNLAQDGGNAMSNPAGVLFRLEIVGETNCEQTTEPEEPEDNDDEDPENYRLDGHKYETEGESNTPVAGWTIFAENLADDSDDVLSTTTDSNGYYYFDVEGISGDNWKVYEEMREDWEQVAVWENDTNVTDQFEPGPAYCTFDVDYDYPVYKLLQVVDEWDDYDEEEYQCDFYNNELEDEEPPIITPDNNENNRSNGGGGTRVKKKPAPAVLGAATSQCEMYLFDYMKAGLANDEFEVKKLQLFLNVVEGNNLPVTGVFDQATDEAVKAFQLKHQIDVLTPWYVAGIVPHNNPTGWVYQLTRWKINNIVCPGSEALPTLLP